MRVALIDSGLGLLSPAAALLAREPGLELVLSMDPAEMPWGAKSPELIRERAMAGAEAAAAYDVAAVVVACNTASVHALRELRSRFEPRIPVIGTVPAVKPASGSGLPFAIWATPATTASGYQKRLVEEFGADVPVFQVPCPTLAPAIESGEADRVVSAVKDAVSQTPDAAEAVVLGSTHYRLATDVIAAQMGARVKIFDSAEAVAAQTLRRLAALGQAPAAGGTAKVTFLVNGVESAPPPPVSAYAAGRMLAALAA